MKMYKKRKTARIVGVLILLAYSLLGSGNPDAKIVGMLLETISGLAVILIALLMYPFFKPLNERFTFWYIVFRSIEGALMIIAGILFLSNNALLLEIRDGIYLGHGYIFAVAALIFYYLLYQSRLIPRWLPVWGGVAAIFLVIVNILEVAGIAPQLMILYLPIILNEIVIAIWLITKGFNTAANVTSSDKTEINGK